MKVLDLALFYHRQGFSVIPIVFKTKKPRLKKWESYQTQRADENQIRKWFSEGGNVGVVCGAVSGNLGVRDFDISESYDRWKSGNPELAERLPTVQTSRGYHVHFRISERVNFEEYPDGELRGEGHYVLAPPSIHPDGPKYRWIIPIPETGVPVIGQAESASLTQGYTRVHSTQYTRVDGGVDRDYDSVSTLHPTIEKPPAVSKINLTMADSIPPIIRSIIEATIPDGPGKRHRAIRERFVPRLKSMPGFENLAKSELTIIARAWFDMALAYIGTKDFETTLLDFLDAYSGTGEHPVYRAAKAARNTKPPKMLTKLFPAEPWIGHIACLGRELQSQHGQEPFPLSCRMAAEVMPIFNPNFDLKDFHETAAKALRILTELGILQLVKRGQRGMTGVASEYRYIFHDDGQG